MISNLKYTFKEKGFLFHCTTIFNNNMISNQDPSHLKRNEAIFFPRPHENSRKGRGKRGWGERCLIKKHYPR